MADCRSTALEEALVLVGCGHGDREVAVWHGVAQGLEQRARIIRRKVQALRHRRLFHNGSNNGSSSGGGGGGGSTTLRPGSEGISASDDPGDL